LLILVIYIFKGFGPEAVEGRTCRSPSQNYKGFCMDSSNCSNICKSEGFTVGKCLGFLFQCFCLKDC
ncbi:hypothetical protein Leryth_026703, partial [Lithospermum erythrorhizon]